jgi:hypothetical protein
MKSIPQTNKERIISIRLNDELYNKLMIYKEKNNINISLFIRGIIADRLEYLRRKKK